MTAPSQCDHEAALFAALFAALDAVLSEDLDDRDDQTLAEAFTAERSEP